MDRDIANNRKAGHKFHILETLEAGISLRGTEVKSIRAGKISIAEAYALVEKGEVFLYNCDIQPYAFGNRLNHEPKRRRKLLLHKSEIKHLFGKVSLKGHALVPLKVYFKNGRIKVLLGVGQGKTAFDKRQDIKQRDDQRQTRRLLGRRDKGG